MKKLAAAFLILLSTGIPVLAADHAVVFAYHRFGEDRVPATNIRLEQFDAHLKMLEEGGFTVWPLSHIVRALQDGTGMPDRTVALTADDAYRSVMTEAWPRMKQRGWTMTLFVATDGVDQGIRGYLNWDDIRQLRNEGMEIGAHSAAHGHMAGMSLEEARADLERSNRRFREELGAAPELFAWPYGEVRLELLKLAADSGYTASLGQHSSPVSAQEPMHYLPRFAMNELYGKPERFRLAANSLPLPVSDVSPAELLLPRGLYPTFAFTVGKGVRPDRISCFHSSSGAKQTLQIDGRRLSFRPTASARPGRSRFNCTAASGKGRFHWFGRQYVTPGVSD